MRFALLFVSAMASVAFAAPLDGSDIQNSEAIHDNELDAELMPSRVLASAPDQVLSARDGCCSTDAMGGCVSAYMRADN